MLRWSNCWLFARRLIARREASGREPYLVKRRSRLAPWFPHYLVAERRASGSVRMVSFVPVAPRRRLVPPPLFRGRVKWGDRPE